MNLRKFLFALSICLTIIHLSALAQRDSIALTSIIDKTSKYTSGHPVEKVFLHFDKPYYALGDTIWVKAYVTVDLHVPSPLSKIVYIDFTDGQNVLVSELKLQLINGTANSYLPLPAKDFKPGNYHVRAYTRWMRNFDQAYFFNKTISIGSSESGQVIPRIAFKNAITDKISKINASVIYKDEDGKPYANKKVSWKVTSDDDNISKGKGETDANGKLDISFSTDKSSALAAAIVVTDLEMDDKRVVSKTFPMQTEIPTIDCQFFPEGGYLINGVRSRVAFKALKPDGLGIDSKGTVTDNTGAVLAEFTSQHLGMGVFAIQPEDGKTYKANLTFADGTKTSFDLPTARDEGINMSLNNNNKDTLSLKITANDIFFHKNQNKTFYVIAQSNGVICYAAQTVLKSAVYGANIPKDKFPTGIVQVTVFSSKGSPLSERIAFIRHDDLLSLNLKSDRSTYSRRQKVAMTFSAKNKTAPVEGNFSVAVVDEGLVPFDEGDETTILSHLLLTSDLRGYIEKPNYYFSHTDDKANADLDILMLTQGYRRFSYKSIIADKIPPITFLPEQGIEISGTLRTNSGLPVSKGVVRMMIPDKNFSSQATTNADGAFRFANVLVSDSSKVTLNARDNISGSNMVITVNSITGPPTTQYINPVGGISNIDSAIHAYLENNKKQLNSLNIPHMLNEVVIKAKPNERRQGHQDYPTLSGLPMEADHTIPGSNFKGCPVFAQCLAGAGPGLTYDNGQLYISRDYNSGSRKPVQIFVSGMEVDFNYLNNVNSDMVESVELFNSDGFSGINRGTDTKGVLEVNMKKAPVGEKISKEQLMDMLPKPYLVTLTPGGYNASKLFYSPKYTNPATANTGVDLRSTIYWNPVVVTDNNGAASFNYYNADGIGTYRAIIQGIDKDGNVGWFVYRYKVQ
ncbi:MAG: Ig-like domain-containing protein [Sphingobacteriales bacterium]